MFSNKTEKMAPQDVRDSSNIIGKGTFLEGNIESFGNIRIEGKVNGNVKSKSKIALGQSSFVEGNIVSQNAEIEGEVSGKLEISELLTLKPTAVINGDIYTNKLIVESGATINGNCKMGTAIKEIKIGSEKNGKSTQQEKVSSSNPKSL